MTGKKRAKLAITTVALVSGLCLIVGCGENDMTPSIHECSYQDSPLAWDEASPEGIVAESLLAQAEVDLQGLVATSIDGTEEKISFSITRRGDHAIYRTGDCQPMLDIPLTVVLISEDGDTFNETFEARGTVNHSGESLNIYHRFELSEISGTYSPEIQQPGATFHDHELFISVGPDESYAVISTFEELHQGDTVSSTGVPYWTWAW